MGAHRHFRSDCTCAASVSVLSLDRLALTTLHTPFFDVEDYVHSLSALQPKVLLYPMAVLKRNGHHQTLWLNVLWGWLVYDFTPLALDIIYLMEFTSSFVSTSRLVD